LKRWVLISSTRRLAFTTTFSSKAISPRHAANAHSPMGT
jgi:hypothetical protein